MRILLLISLPFAIFLSSSVVIADVSRPDDAEYIEQVEADWIKMSVIPPDIPSQFNPILAAKNEGEYFLSDVKQSLLLLPEDRPIVELRIFKILSKQTYHTANEPKLGYANAESPRVLLGTIPVDEKGSAYFRAPAVEPLYFQAVDASGRAVQTMHSASYLQPGEIRGCIGCHEQRSLSVPPNWSPRIKSPSTIKPGPEGTNPIDYSVLVQPILDAHCVSCHNGEKSSPSLTGEKVDDIFTRSYVNLRPYVRWYEWGNETISPIVTHPGESGADMSPLTQILNDENHASLELDDAELRKIYLWLDSNAPFWSFH